MGNEEAALRLSCAIRREIVKPRHRRRNKRSVERVRSEPSVTLPSLSLRARRSCRPDGPNWRFISGARVTPSTALLLTAPSFGISGSAGIEPDPSRLVCAAMHDCELLMLESELARSRARRATSITFES